jgi:hypothetical protein
MPTISFRLRGGKIMKKCLADEMGDDWINAVEAFIAWTPPDQKPLAAMLRGDAPIPPGIRDALAELIDPGKPEYLGCKLVLKETGEIQKNLLWK